jgi:serine/threonine protein kinase HipA of HipAB toxin-antitoxin module
VNRLAPFPERAIVLAPVLLAIALAGCGRGGNDELMRRVAQADAAASRAEAAAVRAEQAANRAANNGGGDEEPTVVEADEPFGQGTEPEPMAEEDG